MIKTTSGLIATLVLSAAAAAAQSQSQVPGTQVPGAQTPGLPPGTPTQPVAPVRPATPAPAPSATAARTFTAPVGLLFNTVKTDKAADFEKLIAKVRAALDSSTDPKLKEQAKGWHFYKAAEPGPNNSVLYVFVIDPTVPGEDYGLGRVLSQGATDTAALQEIWKLYTSSVTTGGSLLNLAPIPEPAEGPAAGDTPLIEVPKTAAPAKP